MVAPVARKSLWPAWCLWLCTGLRTCHALAFRQLEPEAFAMPLDHGCGFDQHHGVEDLWQNPVKPHPEEPVGRDEPKLTRALPPQDGHLMSQGDELKLQ